MSTTILGHLITHHFSDQAEVAATESLVYLLSSSASTRVALHRLISQRVPSLPDDLVYRGQVISEGSAGRPDVVGFAPDGQRRIIVEGKFWAGLTDQQPVGYLKLLPSDRGVLARQYICRFSSFRRLTWPSTCPLLQVSVSPACTAA